MMKKCSKCKEVKPYSDFHKDKKTKDGFHCSCKYCKKQYYKQYYEENKERIKQWGKEYYQENKEKIKQFKKQYYKQYYEENKEKLNQRGKQYYEENKEKIKQYDKQYYKENIDRIKQYREENKEKIKQYLKQYHQENKEKLIEKQKQYYEENKEKLIEKQKQHYEENKEKIKQRQKQYREENKDKRKQYNKKYKKLRIKTDAVFKLRYNISSLIRNSLKNKGYSKNTNTHKILGLEYKDFYTWLNTEASNGLDFNKDDVHVDHVIPVSFGKTEEQVLALNHYSNLQLLTSEENKNKSNTYIKQSNLDRVMTHHPNYSMLTKILLNYDYLIF